MKIKGPRSTDGLLPHISYQLPTQHMIGYTVSLPPVTTKSVRSHLRERPFFEIRAVSASTSNVEFPSYKHPTWPEIKDYPSSSLVASKWDVP